MLRTELRTVDPRAIRLLEINARYMRHETYQQLVANVRADGCLTSTPLCWIASRGPDGDLLEVLSGNHRVRAAIDAGVPEVTVLVLLDDLPHDKLVAIQLSHNAIDGEDDPALLKQLYDSIGDVDLRAYAGLDDRTLGLLAEVDIGALSEANLDFQSVSLVFLPGDVSRVKEVFEKVRKITAADERWIAPLDDYERVMEALDTVHHAHRVTNVATALMLAMMVVERHLGDFAEGWTGPDGTATRAGTAPVEAVLGARAIPAGAAAVITTALRSVTTAAELPDDAPPWRALEFLAADYLAGPD